MIEISIQARHGRLAHEPPRPSQQHPWIRCIGIAAAIAVTLIAVACSSPTGSPTSTSAGTLTIAIKSAPLSLDPAKSGGGDQALGPVLAYEPLIRAKADGSFVPALATSWQYVGEGNKEFQMSLRSDVKFADGTPVDADAVKATIEYYLQAKGPLSSYLYGITAVEALNSTTVRVHLDKPNPTLISVFSQAANYGDIISTAGLKNPVLLGANTFGAGPYQLDSQSTVPGDHYTYVKNPKYWNASAQHYDKIIAKVITDNNSQFQALSSGQLNVILVGPPALLAQVKSAGLELATGSPIVHSVFLMDRTGQIAPELSKLGVRQALNYATDRADIANALGAEVFAPSDQIAGPGSNGYDPALDNFYPHDPTKAKLLLTQAGYSDGFEITMLLYGVAPDSTIAQAIAEQWKAIGVKVTFKDDGTNSALFVSDLRSAKYPITIFTMNREMFSGGLRDFATPSSIFNPFQSNDFKIAAEFNALAVAPSDRQEAAAQTLNKSLVEQAWFVPVVYEKSYIYAHGVAHLNGWGASGGGVFDILDWQPK